MTPRDRFLGTWQLVPELSLYELGAPPASGTYTIAEAGDGLRFEVQWTTAEGAPQATAFSGPPDGTVQPIERPGVDGFSITRLDERTLDSAALRSETVVAHARRVASRDGALLVVLQRGTSPDGQPFQNFQVYRRA